MQKYFNHILLVKVDHNKEESKERREKKEQIKDFKKLCKKVRNKGIKITDACIKNQCFIKNRKIRRENYPKTVSAVYEKAFP